MSPSKGSETTQTSSYLSSLVNLAFRLSFYMGGALLDFISRLAVLTGFEYRRE